jgi:isocitrate dehydrogenase kinase/phosphatase
MQQVLARILHRSYYEYTRQFLAHTGPAGMRFCAADWQGQRMAMRERIHLHDAALAATANDLLAVASRESMVQQWPTLFNHYEKLFDGGFNALALSFFDAVGRMLHRGATPTYLGLVPARLLISEPASDISRLAWRESETAEQLLSTVIFSGDIRGKGAVTKRLSTMFQLTGLMEQATNIELCLPVFYRNRHAYRVGRIVAQMRSMAFVSCFHHGTDGITLNALLFGEEALKNIFSFSRSYFLLHSPWPQPVIDFLRVLMPSKPEAQLYINLGYQFHGKELLLRTVEGQGKNLPELFTEAPGTRGLVMVVLTQRSSELVIKLIRDECKPPKNILPDEVRQKYEFIATHDRVGRMADAQRMDFLRLPRYAFSAETLQLLVRECAQSCMLTGEWLIVKGAYVERKLVPLNLFLQSATDRQIEKALIDFGDAIREMALSNIFAGDLLMKNFGVTAEGRVIFYDYDEVVPVTQCRFREMPIPKYHEQDYEAESWFPVADEDVFPEEWRKFLVPEGKWRIFFDAYHATLFSAAYWNKIKSRHESGEVIDLQPYEANL